MTEKTLCKKTELMNVLKKKDFEILLTMGAGDIDRYVSQVKQLLEKQ